MEKIGEDLEQVDKETENIVLQGFVVHYLSLIGNFPEDKLEVLYLKVPPMRKFFDSLFDKIIREFDEFKAQVINLRKRSMQGETSNI